LQRRKPLGYYLPEDLKNMFDSPRASQAEVIEPNPTAFQTMEPGQFPSIRRKFDEIESDIRGDDQTKLTDNKGTTGSDFNKTSMSFRTPGKFNKNETFQTNASQFIPRG